MTVESLHFQFPLWDFFECNRTASQVRQVAAETGSQFPLWDFFECNRYKSEKQGLEGQASWKVGSQFPLWDFFECNTFLEYYQPHQIQKISQFPLWDFFECNSSCRTAGCTCFTQTKSLNSLCGISSNATFCVCAVLGR